MRYFNALIITLVFLLGCSNLRPPVAREIPVTNIYHGTEVIDPYQWLEDWDNPQVRAWSESQNIYARGVLDRLASRDQIHRRFMAGKDEQHARRQHLVGADGAVLLGVE